jgi:hypothetical protein
MSILMNDACWHNPRFLELIVTAPELVDSCNGEIELAFHNQLDAQNEI